MLRGPGDFFGFQQSGLRYTGLRAGLLIPHIGILKDAHKMAMLIYNNEMPMLNVREQPIQSLLSVFHPPTSSPTTIPLSSSSSTSTSTTAQTKGSIENTKNSISSSNSISNSNTENLENSIKSVNNNSKFPNLTVSGGDEEPVIILFDLETSGFSAKRGDKIIQIGAKVINDNPINRTCSTDTHFDCYVKTNGQILSPIIINLTKITQHDHDTKGRSFSIVWGEFVEWMQKLSKTNTGIRPIVLIAHAGTTFDIPFLYHEIKKSKLYKKEDDWLIESNVLSFVDSLVLLRNENIWTERKGFLGLSDTEPYKPKDRKLGTIYEYIFQKGISNAHSALGDVIALEAVLESEGIKNIWREYANKIQFNSIQ